MILKLSISALNDTLRSVVALNGTPSQVLETGLGLGKRAPPVTTTRFKRHPPRLPRRLNGTPRHLRNTVRKTTALGGSGVRPCASDFDLILGARRGWLKAECTPNLSEGCVKGKLCPSWFKAGAFSLSSASMDETSNINPSKMSHDLPSHGHPLQCNKIAWD